MHNANVADGCIHLATIGSHFVADKPQSFLRHGFGLFDAGAGRSPQPKLKLPASVCGKISTPSRGMSRTTAPIATAK